MLKVVVPPTEMITVDDAADFMRADFSSSEESLIESLITASRLMCEEYLYRRIGVQTIELREQSFPGGNGAIILPSPLISVSTIKYIDTSNTLQTLDESEYVVSDSDPGLIYPVGAWPSTLVCGDAVRVVAICGYSSGGESPLQSEPIPKTIKTAMLMQIADMYENRESQTDKPLTANMTLERLLSPYRLEMGI